ncbi:response regulator [Paenibacillus psychroresistens]|uniref:Response regulator n=1 Tax=Paenibacillus psychroresistens TaxID=1778678 RepID=A0A6B8RPM4_9BACL|nr:response regulator [Paenibacillus psychroresistens]QGQ98321.1 response regulator [Paenibacillus psychroresistens]
MFKVLVVDDELWIRRGIIQSIEWKSLGLELVGEAADGDEAFEMAHMLKPDIIIMDMRMPGMDGVELLRALNQSTPDAVILVCSGFSDFEYTREAIVNRAFDYLLKPIKDDDMNQAITRAISEVERRRLVHEKESHVSASFVMSKTALLKEVIYSEREISSVHYSDEMFKNLLDANRKAICVCYVEPVEKQTDIKPDHGQLTNYLKEKIMLHLSELGIVHETIVNLAENEVVILLYGDEDLMRKSSLKSTIQKLLQETASGCSVKISAGISEILQKGSSFQPNKLYKEASKALRMKRISDEAAVIFYEPKFAIDLPNGYPAEKENNLLYLLTMGNTKEAGNVFDEMFNSVLKENRTVYEMQKDLIILVGSIEKILHSAGSGLETICGRSYDLLIREITSLMDGLAASALVGSLIDKAGAYFNQINKKDGKKVIVDIIKDLMEHYSEQISLNHYARKYHLNPDYLSRLFKEESHKNFIDYVKEIRVERAKALLIKDVNRNYEIAEMVGYDDYRYFSQVFKKMTGMTLSEYREKFKQVIK